MTAAGGPCGQAEPAQTPRGKKTRAFASVSIRFREAYREQALNHHPDAGGSADAMRRLKTRPPVAEELYRAKGLSASWFRILGSYV